MLSRELSWFLSPVLLESVGSDPSSWRTDRADPQYNIEAHRSQLLAQR
jgi:hypothetical protein